MPSRWARNFAALWALARALGGGYFSPLHWGIGAAFVTNHPALGQPPQPTSLVDHQPKGPVVARNKPRSKTSAVPTVRPWSRQATLPAIPAARSASRVPFMDATEMMRSVIPKMGTLGRYETIWRLVWGNRDQDIIDGKSRNEDIMSWSRFPKTGRQMVYNGFNGFWCQFDQAYASERPFAPKRFPPSWRDWLRQSRPILSSLAPARTPESP